MDSQTLATTQKDIICAYCSKDVSDSDVFCDNCGYPLKGTEQEQKNFRSNATAQEIDLNHYNDEIRKSANSLFYLSGIFVVSGFIMYFVSKDSPDAVTTLILNLVLAFIFLALGGYARKKPLACLISGLCLYAIVIVLNAIIDPITIVRGIIWKIVIIGLLIRGLKAALEVEKIKKENNLS